MAETYAVKLELQANLSALDRAYAKTTQFENQLNKLRGIDPFQQAQRGAQSAATAVDGLSGRFRDVNGRLREANGQFVTLGSSAGKAANEVNKLNNAGNGLSGVAAGVSKLAAAYGALRIAQDAISAGVTRVESTRRITALAGAFNEVEAAQAAAGRASEKFGISQTEANQQFAQLYARLRPIGISLGEIETAFNGFNTGAKLSGASATEASSAWLQLSQALGSGVLRGEELNSIFEQTPIIVQAIAQEMNAPIGKIRELAKDGKITSDIVLRGLKRLR